MKISTRIQLNTLILLGILLIIGLTEYLSYMNMQKLVRESEKINMVRQGSFEINLLTQDYLKKHSGRASTQWYQRHNSLLMLIETLNYSAQENQELQKSIHTDGQDILTIFVKLDSNFSNLVNQENITQFSEELEERLAGQLLIKLQDMVTSIELLEVAIHQQMTEENIKASIFAILLIFLIMVLASIINSVEIRKHVIRPLKKLNEGIKHIGAGKLEHKVATNAQDEIGEISRSFERMATNLAEITVSRDELIKEKAERDAIQKNLEHSERLIKQQLYELDQIYKYAPVGLLFLDKEYRIVRINERLAEIDGWSVEEHIGKTLDEVVPDLADDLKEIYRPVLEKGEPVLNLEIQGETPKEPGVTRDWLANYFPYKGENNEVTGLIGAVVEITDRKRTETSLKESEERFRAVFQTATDGIVTLNQRGIIIHWNDGASRIFGYQPGEIIGKSCSEIMPERFREMHEAGVARFKPAQGNKLSCGVLDLVGLHKNGKEFNVELSLSSWNIENEHFFTGIIRDISDRKKLEAELSEYTHHLGERVKELNCLYGISNLIETDLNTDQILQQTVDLIPPSCQHPERTSARITFNEQTFTSNNFAESQWVQSCQITAQDEQLGSVEVFYNGDNLTFFKNPFSNEELSLIKAICQRLSDTVERKRAEEKLQTIHENLEELVKKRTEQLAHKHQELERETNKRLQTFQEKERLESQLKQSQKMEAIGTLAGGIAHDFNNILSAVLGYAELAIVDFPEENKVKKDIREILRAGNRAKDLVQQILTFSRRSDHELRPLRVQLIAKEVIKLLRSSIPTTIEIKHDINPDCKNVLADPTHIHQLIMNLCTNSYQAMKEAGGVLDLSLQPYEQDQETIDHHISLEPGTSYLHLQISDTGEGMPKEIQNNIFEPYFTTKEKGEGTGLGLAVVHGIITSLRGDISVVSEAGKGATFHVFLPAVEQLETSPQEDIGAPLPTGNEQILFVDDDSGLVYMSKFMFETQGYTVTAVSDSMEALRVFEQSPQDFDLVITDMTMPNMTGAELTKQILAIRPDMPIILCTGYSDLINEEKAKAIGIKEYVMKPASKSYFLQTVRDVLDGKEAL